MRYIILPVIFLIFACKHTTSSKAIYLNSPEEKEVIIVEFGKGVSSIDIEKIQRAIQVYYGKYKKIGPVEIPADAYFRPRKRYRADSLLRWLGEKASKTKVYLGITDKDISFTKGKIKDFGIMGLGSKSESAAIVSTFRLKDKRHLWKVVLHELGHTSGLGHCQTANCLMRDAKGGDSTKEEKDFCSKCKVFLKIRGWRLLSN